MDVEKMRAKIAEFRRMADELEAMLPKPVVFEEDIVIVDDDFLPDAPPPPQVKAEIASDGFQADILDAIARTLRA